MKNIRMTLVDIDQIARAQTRLHLNDENGEIFTSFMREIDNGLVPGETAYLEIEGVKEKPVTFSIVRLNT